MPSTLKQRLSLAIQILRGESIPRLMRDEVPAISSEEVAEARIFFPLEKFFIFGHARSGTTVLVRLLRLHPEVHCNYQAHFFTRPPLLQGMVADEEVHAWLKRGSNRWNRGGDLSPVVLRACADYILERDARREGKRIVGDKSPNNLMNGNAVRLMHNIYPDARLIFIVRDGRDTVLSHRFQTFIDAPQQLSKEDRAILADYTRNPEDFLNDKRSIFTEKGLRRAAEGWVRNVQETHQLGQELYQARYFSLRYEDLLLQPWQVVTRLWSFLGASEPDVELRNAVDNELAENPDAEWQRKKAQNLIQPLQKGKQGSWREMFTQRDREIFHQVAGETLKAWGYEV